jgi:hypothetical protein
LSWNDAPTVEDCTADLAGEEEMIPKPKVRLAKQTDLNREFDSPKRTTEWSWFFAALIAVHDD